MSPDIRNNHCSDFGFINILILLANMAFNKSVEKMPNKVPTRKIVLFPLVPSCAYLMRPIHTIKTKGFTKFTKKPLVKKEI